MTSPHTAHGRDRDVSVPALSHFATIEVEVDAPITIGQTIDGLRKVVPIRGGRVYGQLTGKVLDAGADFQHYPSPALAHLAADYVMHLDDGHHVLVQNRALRTGRPEDLEQLMNGVPVDPARIYFRCVPRLVSDLEGPYGWLSDVLFIGSGERQPLGVRIEIFRVH